jgi:copper ion binding protein
MSTAPTSPRTVNLPVEGMTCGSCAARIEKTLTRQPGIAGAAVNFATGSARVTTDGPVDWDAVAVAVEKVGYRVEVPTAAMDPADGPVEFDVEGMTCGSCAARIQKVLSRHEGSSAPR